MTLPPCYQPLDDDEEPQSAPPPSVDDDTAEIPSRRSFLIGSALATATAFVAPLLTGETAAKSAKPATKFATKVALDINGKVHQLELDPRASLLDVLREQLDLTGAKKGCDQGACGACTVLIDDRRVNSCLTLAVMHGGKKIVTIEGLSGDAGALHPVQAAFIRNDGFQCGYCTPGQICSAVALLREGHAKSDDEIREWMSGNLCRCGAYVNIVAAVREAANATV